MITHHGLCRIKHSQKEDERQEHHIAHIARPGCADIDAIHVEGEQAGKPCQRRPGQIFHGFNMHILGPGKKRNNRIAKDQQEEGDETCHHQPPDEGKLCTAPEGGL